jgi:hypothetical protein
MVINPVRSRKGQWPGQTVLIRYDVPRGVRPSISRSFDGEVHDQCLGGMRIAGGGIGKEANDGIATRSVSARQAGARGIEPSERT